MALRLVFFSLTFILMLVVAPTTQARHLKHASLSHVDHHHHHSASDLVVHRHQVRDGFVIHRTKGSAPSIAQLISDYAVFGAIKDSGPSPGAGHAHVRTVGQ
ncbi:hypothetical protein AMTR_s00019p00140560 [Amborella trichopoda]|uniref:Uncharacterized protein n=1 Tax=Amborella trichopoda TaxID=13333 RepID=W1PB92_AMBTC|nr:hypothetical protein AMTR_s00019p00140560 [Amborella trichopoda]